jgi:putative ABC transport system substrate-binding protein
MKRKRADCVIVQPSLVYREVIDLALEHHLPSLSPSRLFVEAGGLMGHAAQISELHREAAVYVDKILKGMKPAELPVQQPTKFELIINARTARVLGLEIPSALLARADNVIE